MAVPGIALLALGALGVAIARGRKRKPAEPGEEPVPSPGDLPEPEGDWDPGGLPPPPPSPPPGDRAFQGTYEGFTWGAVWIPVADRPNPNLQIQGWWQPDAERIWTIAPTTSVTEAGNEVRRQIEQYIATGGITPPTPPSPPSPGTTMLPGTPQGAPQTPGGQWAPQAPQGQWSPTEPQGDWGDG